MYFTLHHQNMQFFRILVLLSLTYSVQSADPNCYRGLKNSDQSVCCPADCGKCGGDNCESRNGGYSKCCASPIKSSGRKCQEQEAPCILSSTPYMVLTTSVKRPSTLSLYPGAPLSVYDREAKYNVKFSGIMMYQPASRLNFDYVKNYLNAGKKVQLVIEFEDGYSNLQEIASGKFDYQLKAFAKKAKADGRPFTIRLMHEMNGDWYPWGIGRGSGNSAYTFKEAYRHVVYIFKNAGVNAKYQLSYNITNSPKVKATWRDMYPGDDVVDEICVSAYNRAGLDGRTDIRSFESILQPWYQAMSFNTKPLCIAEMSSMSYYGDKAAWIKSAWNGMAQKFPRLRTINWFLVNKGNRLWDLNTSSERTAFTSGFYAFKSATGGAGDEIDNEEEDVEAQLELEQIAVTEQEKYDEELQREGKGPIERQPM